MPATPDGLQRSSLKRRVKAHKGKGELQDLSPHWLPQSLQQSPHPFPAASRADDDYSVRRTRTQPALARQYVQDARGSPGPSPARLASRLLRSRHPRSSATASVRGLRRSEAAGSAPVPLSGGACGPPLPLLPRWPRAPLLRGESRWRRLWLCEEDGRGGGVGKAASKKSQGFSGGQGRSESPGRCYLIGFGCFKQEERSGGSGCSGWARYKEGKHGGGGLRRRRRGKRLCGGHGGGWSGAVNRAAPCLNGGLVGCAVLRVPVRGCWAAALARPGQ